MGDPSSLTYNDTGALGAAVQKGDVDVVKALADQGDVGLSPEEDELHSALYTGPSLESTTMLLGGPRNV